MTPVKIPDIEGIVVITPLEMNAVRFNRRHTVLTPAKLAAMRARAKDSAGSEKPADSQPKK